MARNLTDQVRNIADVTTAVATSDLSRKITVDARREILELKNTVNTMVDQPRSFAAEVTRVAREVGTEGKLGGQAEVESVSGTWRRLTENVHQLAGNLTTQVRAIAEVSTAVTQGDLRRSISVEAQGEVAELKDNINQMIANLRETTERNAAQDWLKTNLASISGILQGPRDLAAVTQLIMSEVTPTVDAQHGAFFLAEASGASGAELVLQAAYGFTPRRSDLRSRFEIGEGLIGQAAFERKTIALSDVPPGYIKVGSGLGDAAPADILVMPVLFEDQVLGVIELASIHPFSAPHRDFLDRITETIGVVINTIRANVRTEELLAQSQGLTQELQKQSEELRKTNDELQEKARLLSEQNRDIEIKNEEIELARRGLEEKAAQLALSSKYKSEFLANMSHELRTPLNSMLILSRLLGENEDGSLTPRQVEFNQILKNLLSNALKFTHDGGVTLAIGYPAADHHFYSESLQNTDTVIAFAVVDTGVGIPDDKLGAIFEAFQQADGTTSRKYGGTGLGLSISREIARLLGGEIQVDDRVILIIDPDPTRARTLVEAIRVRGTKAIVARRPTAALGLAREHRPHPVILAGESTRIEDVLAGGDEVELVPVSPARALATLRTHRFDLAVVVLGASRAGTLGLLREIAIDDVVRELPVISYLDTQLPRPERARLDALAKSAVITVTDSPERLHQHPNTDLMLLDIMMPEMDGYETARAIRSMSRFEHLPIISLTAKAMKGDREKAIAAGASDYITKPVDLDHLLSMMRVWLDA